MAEYIDRRTEGNMKTLKKGDPCPCCGKPIGTDDEDVLRLLSWVAGNGRLPGLKEIAQLYREGHPESGTENDNQ